MVTSSLSFLFWKGGLFYNKYQAYKDPENTSPLNLPVIAYLGTDRLHGSSRKRVRAKGDRIGRYILEEGYHNWAICCYYTFPFCCTKLKRGGASEAYF